MCFLTLQTEEYELFNLEDTFAYSAMIIHSMELHIIVTVDEEEQSILAVCASEKDAQLWLEQNGYQSNNLFINHPDHYYFNNNHERVMIEKHKIFNNKKPLSFKEI